MNTMTEAMRQALQEAREGSRAGHGGPFGAVIMAADGTIIAGGHNTVLKDNDPSAHAEVNAIRKAAATLGTPHLTGYILIASSEPCPMCHATAYWAGITDIRFAVPIAKAAEVGFDDSFISEDLALPMAERKVRLTHEPELQQEGEKIFTDWDASGGVRY